jgi:hypothetical protein
MSASPAQMDDLYHKMVWSGMSAPNSQTSPGCPRLGHS